MGVLSSQYAGDPPSGWIESVLKAGRGLVIFDGVDEVSVFDRAEVRRRISEIVSTYGTCLFVVTTRPTAVPAEWLGAEAFVEARLDPLTLEDRNELIVRWHRSLEQSGLYPPDDLAQIGRRLITEIEAVPQIAQIAINPLLCAMICALNIDRRGQLPKNQRSLCGALVEALLHRRDAEQRFRLMDFRRIILS